MIITNRLSQAILPRKGSMHLTTCSGAGSVWLPRLSAFFHLLLLATLSEFSEMCTQTTHLSVAAAQPLEKPLFTALTRFSTRYQTIPHAATKFNLNLLSDEVTEFFEYFLSEFWLQPCHGLSKMLLIAYICIVGTCFNIICAVYTLLRYYSGSNYYIFCNYFKL